MSGVLLKKCCCGDPKGPIPCPQIEECLSLPDAFRITITEVIVWIGDVTDFDYYRFELVEHLIHRTNPNLCSWQWTNHDIFLNNIVNADCFNLPFSSNAQWFTRLTCEQGFWHIEFSPFDSAVVCYEMANQNNSPVGTYTAINTDEPDCLSFDTGHKCESEGLVVLNEV